MAEKQFRAFKAQVLQPTFVGKGLDGHLAGEGAVVTVDLEIAASDITDESGAVTTKAGEPIHDDNLKLLGEVDAVEVVPVGAPLGARPTGVPGVFMVPNGDNWITWTEGDPSTQLASRSPEEFRYQDPERPSIADDIESGDLLPAVGDGLPQLDHDGDGKAGGSLSKADLQAALDDRGVSYPANATKADLQELLAQPPA